MRFEDKVDSILEQILYCDMRTSVGIDKAKDIIRQALLSQDKDTRHNCAEAVLTCQECEEVSKEKAHKACMNAHVLIPKT